LNLDENLVIFWVFFSVQMMRNKSLTKEEIEEYWKSNKKTEDEQTEAISSSSEVCSFLFYPFLHFFFYLDDEIS